MAYSSSGSSIESCIEALNTCKTAISNIDMKSSWSGTASTSLNGKINTLLAALSTQTTNAQKIANACKKIDSYDRAKSDEESARNSYNNLDPSNQAYHYASSSLLSQISNAQERKNNAYTEINTNLNGITTSYEKQYKEISFDDEIVYSKEIFDEILNGSEDITNTFDLSKNRAVHTYSGGNGTYDMSVYSENADNGFVITQGNKTYNLSKEDYDLLAAIISAECDGTYDDALAVASVIFNRCADSRYLYSHGDDPVAQATAPSQFVVYEHGSYKKYMPENGGPREEVINALNAVCDGVRNNRYIGFRSNGSTSYSNNMITPTGNRYNQLIREE